MHIIGIIISILVGGAVWYWRLRMLRGAVTEVIDVGQTLANLPRKMRFKKATRAGQIKQIDDPRFAVATLLYMLCSSDGALKESEETLIKLQLQSEFSPNADDLNEMETFGHWAAGELASKSSAPRELVRQIAELAPNAGGELVKMVTAVEAESKADLYLKVSESIKKEFGLAD